jgi:hypothetical protein
MAMQSERQNDDRSQQGKAQRQNQDKNQKPGRNGQGNVQDDMIRQGRSDAGRDAHTNQNHNGENS